MSKLFVFLYSGGVNSTYNHSRYKNDLQRLGNDLVQKPGCSVATMTFMCADGTDQFLLNGHAGTVLAASRNNLQAGLATLAAAVAPEDRFIFVASNHGGQDSGTSILYCWNEESVNVADFATWCAGIRSKRQVFIFGQCYSGGFLP